MPCRLVTGPTEEPVDLDLAKSHLRLETELDDDYVTMLITGARQLVESWCWRGLLKQTWELTLPGFRGEDRWELAPPWRPAAPSFFTTNWIQADTAYRFAPFLELDRGHLARLGGVDGTSNVSITYLDKDGVRQTLSPSAYLIENVDADERTGRIWLNENGGFAWPMTYEQFDAVKITFDIGWDSADVMPFPLKQAILLQLADMYENRVPVDVGSRWAPIQLTAVDVLISPYRFVRI